MQAPLIRFLQKDLEIPADSIAIALRQCKLTPDQLPMILWQYGLITIEQLEKIFDWLETETGTPDSKIAISLRSQNSESKTEHLSAQDTAT